MPFCLFYMFSQFNIIFAIFISIKISQLIFFLCTGAAKSTWIRIPVIIYSSHVVTTLIAIFYHMLTSDFTNSKYPGPATMKERLTLMSIYSPYFIIPLLNLCDACFSSAYKEGKKIKRQQNAFLTCGELFFFIIFMCTKNFHSLKNYFSSRNHIICV